VRFPARQWLLAPCTTWRARRTAAGDDRLDARTAWALARLSHHPEELPFALKHLHERE
jgi:hypothetical protein